MSDYKWSKKNTISVQAAASKIGIKKNVLEYHIQNGAIECEDGRILKEICDEIINQKNLYIGIKEFIIRHDSSLFIAKYANNRNKYIDFLEENDYFEVERYSSEGLLFTEPDTEEFYFLNSDVSYLDLKSKEFFEEFGLTEQEKINRIIDKTEGLANTKKYLRKFGEDYLKGEAPKPSYTYFVKIMMSVEDVKKITAEEISSIIEEESSTTVINIVAAFYNYVSRLVKVNYKKVEPKKKETNSIPAYSFEKYVELARILFQVKYDELNKLTERALENYIYAETWLFLSLHYVCGWRASDVCDNWVYLNLQSSENPFGIIIDEIKENILSNKIPPKTYIDICHYSIEKIKMLNLYPSKTSTVKAGKLRAMVTPDLKEFIGKLILIAEYHYQTIGEGYMKSYRVGRYLNWVNLREFFGEDIYKLTGRNNILSRRLTKSYLQGIENAARENGESPLMAHIIASYVRNHTNVNTTLIYLRDHGLTGESADFVLYTMLQRGVMSMYLYKVLITAFPESFKKLTSEEQTEIMNKINVSALELESLGGEELSSLQMYKEFSKGNTEEATIILKAMYSVGQGKGVAKDDGIFCQKRALGYICESPTYESCIANLCPYHIFTTAGIPSLIKVIKEYNEKIDYTGNDKYKIALEKVIIPAFQEIINEIIKEMSKEEKTATLKLIEDKLYEYNIK